MKKVSGAESLTEQELEIIRQRHAESSFGQLLGFEPVEAAPGRVVLRLPFSARLLQSLGRVHGGALFSLADHLPDGPPTRCSVRASDALRSK